MNLRLFALKLHLCEGVGIKTEFLIWQYLQENRHDESIASIVFRAGIPAKQVRSIREAWETPEHLKLVEQHWQNCQFVTIFDENYPAQLRETYCPPMVLFYRGNFDLLKMTMVGIVGARRNTSYGRMALEHIIPGLIERKICVVSGLADGIDGISHEIAMKSGGRTIGIIGTGLDRIYPVRRNNLQSIMEEKELVLSEYPLGSPPSKFHFPQRNRIIAGLTQTLLVVEAKEKSGSLITASLSLQENRNVCAIPGRIDAPMSTGCNQLIAAGAKPILAAEDLFNEFVI